MRWPEFRNQWHGTTGPTCAACSRPRYPYDTCESILCRNKAADAFKAMHERAALTRALTAQAWAVACVLFAFPWSEVWPNVQRIAALPAPADLAAELMGDG